MVRPADGAGGFGGGGKGHDTGGGGGGGYSGGGGGGRQGRWWRWWSSYKAGLSTQVDSCQTTGNYLDCCVKNTHGEKHGWTECTCVVQAIKI